MAVFSLYFLSNGKSHKQIFEAVLHLMAMAVPLERPLFIGDRRKNIYGLEAIRRMRSVHFHNAGTFGPSAPLVQPLTIKLLKNVEIPLKKFATSRHKQASNII